MAQLGAASSELPSNGLASPEIELTSPRSRKPHRHATSWTSPRKQYHRLDSHDRGADDSITETGTRFHSLRTMREAAPTRQVEDSPTQPANTFIGMTISYPSTDERGVPHTPYGKTAPEYGDIDVDNASRDHHASLHSSRQPMGISEGGYQDISQDTSLIQHDHPPSIPCPTQGDLLKARWGWFTYTIIGLGLFSTVFSAIFFGIAIRKPRWGRSVGTKHSTLSYSGATLLTALFSKLIELSFACVFVATLGQILSRRAFAQRARTAKQGGISIAEMNMRLWILQPGTLITHWDGVKYTFKTVLGGLALISAIAAALYITAAEALVSPKLGFGKNETMVVAGNVTTIYANTAYLSQSCETPLDRNAYQEVGETCMQMRYAGQGFRNLDYWMSGWAQMVNRTSSLLPEGGRPPPVAMLYDNTTVRGQWIFPTNENITADSAKYGRLVQNVTMAMPHANVFHAVRDPKNSILQPDDLFGAGEYRLQASVPVPALNVLCVGMTRAEIEPLISYNDTPRSRPSTWPVRTAVDEIFDWDMSVNSTQKSKPFFAVVPTQFNTVVSKDIDYGPNAIYLLATPPNTTITTSEHIVCALRSLTYHDCTTSYHEAQSGGELAVHCSYRDFTDVHNTLPYSRSAPDDAFNGFDSNWVQIGIEWMKAVALSHNAGASSARELTQMTPNWMSSQETVLSTNLPSLGEALAVLAGCTLLMATDASPFVASWNHTNATYDQAQYQYFNALLSYKDYASGSVRAWQGVFFYPTLLIVFLLSLFCLIYLVWTFSRDGEVTDYTEPQNLFALAINSPPSHSLAGSCGAGPSGEMLKKKWMVGMATSAAKSTSTPGAATQTFASAAPSPNVGEHYELSQYSPRGRSTAMTTGVRYSNHPHFYVRCAEDDDYPLVSRTQTPAIQYTHTSTSVASSTTTTPQLGFTYHPPQPPSRGHTPKHSTSSPLLGLGFRHNLSSNYDDNSNNNKSGHQRGRKSKSVASVADWSVEESPAVQQYMRLSGRT